jgi:hypothetical protein
MYLATSLAGFDRMEVAGMTGESIRIIVIIVSVIGVVLSAVGVTVSLKRGLARWIIISFIVALLVALAAALASYYLCFSTPRVAVAVVSLTSGEVACDKIVEGQCRITVEGTIKPLEPNVINDDTKLYVVLRASGNAPYWVGGDAVPPEALMTGKWKVSDVGVGAKDSPNPTAWLQAVVTTSSFGSGENMKSLPRCSVRSAPVQVSWK